MSDVAHVAHEVAVEVGLGRVSHVGAEVERVRDPVPVGIGWVTGRGAKCVVADPAVHGRTRARLGDAAVLEVDGQALDLPVRGDLELEDVEAPGQPLARATAVEDGHARVRRRVVGEVLGVLVGPDCQLLTAARRELHHPRGPTARPIEHDDRDRAGVLGLHLHRRVVQLEPLGAPKAVRRSGLAHVRERRLAVGRGRGGRCHRQLGDDQHGQERETGDGRRGTNPLGRFRQIAAAAAMGHTARFALARRYPGRARPAGSSPTLGRPRVRASSTGAVRRRRLLRPAGTCPQGLARLGRRPAR